ncbi:MAG: tetratricopeptide repeat protein [Leptolyngbyaceae cyanobacterium SM1_1_3]|nr:tetratricopeptide repeat protein [Leptolyngbyaceae cyanobacterium SM1_1_3]NJN03678.1 tetratricopeptide repeat protein [Leptolyngbyaceae cyanobacterium RM1_1_2]NJO09141.1 tetratricopeptide repeat protein [Leptolyngbyaceae cyanobacterium SL_1_1]
MPIRLLDHAIEKYESKISALEKSAPDLSVEKILDTLIARDVIYALAKSKTRGFSISPATLADLDYRLRAQAEFIAQAADLAELRSSFHPTTDAWWWYFEAPIKRHWWDKYDPYWNMLAAILLAISIYILFEISTQLLRGEPDTISSIFATLQTTLTTIAIGALVTKDGREKIDQILRRFNIPIHFQQEGRLILAGLLLVALLAFSHVLPQLSNLQVSYGLSAYEEGRLSTAQDLYKRAIKFNPDNVEARFYLGSLYEDINDLDSALNEYQLVVRSNYPAGHNNLGRLYILNEDYENASYVLQQGLAIVRQGDFIQRFPWIPVIELKYSLSKNLGWVRLEQDSYHEAKSYLEEAISIERFISSQTNGETLLARASAYCLSAQVAKELEEGEEVINQFWEQCLQYADPLNPDEDKWIRIARQLYQPQ